MPDWLIYGIWGFAAGLFAAVTLASLFPDVDQERAEGACPCCGRPDAE